MEDDISPTVVIIDLAFVVCLFFGTGALYDVEIACCYVFDGLCLDPAEDIMKGDGRLVFAVFFWRHVASVRIKSEKRHL